MHRPSLFSQVFYHPFPCLSMIIFNFFEKFSAHILCFSGNNIPVPTKRRCPHGQQEQQPEQESEQEPEQQGQQSEQGSEHQQREQLPLNAYKVKEPQALPAVLFCSLFFRFFFLIAGCTSHTATLPDKDRNCKCLQHTLCLHSGNAKAHK